MLKRTDGSSAKDKQNLRKGTSIPQEFRLPDMPDLRGRAETARRLSFSAQRTGKAGSGARGHYYSQQTVPVHGERDSAAAWYGARLGAEVESGLT